MTSILNRDTNTVTVATFYENYLLGKYNFDPPYQRKSVWTDEKQSFLIDSIIKNFPIPPIFLHQHIDDETGKTEYDIIDGKQRLTSIVRFIRNEIPVSSEFEDTNFYDQLLAGAYFVDLDQPELSEYKRKFWRYIIPIEYLDTTSKSLIDNIFDRLNRNGEPLTGQELRNAKYHDTDLLNLVEKLADHRFWSARLAHVDLSRMENYEFVSELIFVLLEKGPMEALPPIIDALYEKYTHGQINWNSVEHEFYRVTKFLEALDLNYEGYKIKGVSHLYGLWCFAWVCEQQTVQPEMVRDKLNALFTELRSSQVTNEYVQDYRITMSSNTKSKAMRERRLEALLRYCGVELPSNMIE
jgi:hypothetical protein